MIRAIFHDDSGKPEQIPLSKWPVKNRPYHVVWIAHNPIQDVLMCQLAELTLDESCVPHEFYRLDRFIFAAEDLFKLRLLMIDCAAVQDAAKELVSLAKGKTV